MFEQRERSRGVTLTELLVVVSIIALAVTIAIPMISRVIVSARLRGAANQYAVTVRAVRMIAVSQKSTAALTVNAGEDWYEYIDSTGRIRRVEMPEGVSIARFEMPAGIDSSDPILFQSNGLVAQGQTTATRFEARPGDGQMEVWEVRTTPLGGTEANRYLE